MSDMATSDAAREALGLGGIVLATAGAAVVALVLLVTVVAPAEYGVDPTGIGKRLGMKDLFQDAPASTVLWNAQAERRSDTATVILPPGDGIEVKATMREGQQLLFTWYSKGGPVHLETHGDPAEGDTYSSYDIVDATEGGSGGLSAPFDGEHGWYWRNDNDTDVVVTVETIGYYELLETK